MGYTQCYKYCDNVVRMFQLHSQLNVNNSHIATIHYTATIVAYHLWACCSSRAPDEESCFCQHQRHPRQLCLLIEHLCCNEMCIAIYLVRDVVWLLLRFTVTRQYTQLQLMFCPLLRFLIFSNNLNQLLNNSKQHQLLP